MGTSNPKYPVYEPEKFYNGFPHLDDRNHDPTSPATPEPGRVKKPYYLYNCFAFVVGDKKKFWWPDDEYSHWPRKNAPNTVAEIMAVLSEFGYEECMDGAHEKGVQKIAIFECGGEPVHVSIQPTSRNGKWKSKMGYNIDMEHDLHSIETWPGDKVDQGYGVVVKFMRFIRNSSRSL